VGPPTPNLLSRIVSTGCTAGQRKGTESLQDRDTPVKRFDTERFMHRSVHVSLTS